MEASEYHQLQALAMSEATLQVQVETLARAFGWLTYHTHDSRRSQAGFPDLCMVRLGQVVFAELKSQKGRVRPDQAEWLDRLKVVAKVCKGAPGLPPVQTYLWRPADMLSGAIERVLR